MLQGDSEQGLSECALDVVEEGLLGLWRHSVDGAESQTEKAVIVNVLLEFGTDSFGSLDSLLGSGNSTDNNGICVNVTAGTATIAVGDIPSISTKLGSALARVVDRVARLLRSRKLSREDPAMTLLA